jgi:Uncharacterised nucleotidyltransferase
VPEADVDSFEPLQWAVQSFGVDRVTAEVVSALGDASIPTILLKGPAIALWLYAGDRPRPYADTDLLVRRADWRAAMEVLLGKGFVDGLGHLAHPRMEAGDGYPWVRPADEAEVDLHYTLFGVGAEPEDLWEAFFEGSAPERLGGIEVRMPSHPARLLHIALHAVQHGGKAEIQRKPIRDLEQALAKAEPRLWEQARDLAERLRAMQMFSNGLYLLPEGAELAAGLGVKRDRSPAAAVRMAEVPLAEGFKELAETPGLRAKARLVVRELFPNREFMLWWSPLARRGRLGIAAAYVARPFLLLVRALPGYLAWRRARRGAA